MAGDTCTVAAMWAPLQRRRRNATTWAATAAGSARGCAVWPRAAVAQSAPHPRPDSGPTHSRTVRAQTPTATATAAGGWPWSSTRSDDGGSTLRTSTWHSYGSSPAGLASAERCP